MAILGINSLFLCGLFYTARLVPRPIAGFGFLGYLLLLASAVLDLAGVAGAKPILSLLYLPGGIFEAIVFPVWLAIVGFPQDQGKRP
jgi:hypothetical protein